MQQQKAGHIINVSSVAGHKVTPAGAVYCATKHAVRALSEGLRQEVKAYNIRTTVISPGAVATELPDSITEHDVSKDIHEFYDEFAIPADTLVEMEGFKDLKGQQEAADEGGVHEVRNSQADAQLPKAYALSYEGLAAAFAQIGPAAD